MRLTLVAIILTFGLLNCKDNEVKVNIQTNGYLTLIDSSLTTENLRQYSIEDNYGIYPVYYSGELLDTISLSKFQIPRYGHGEKGFDPKMKFRPPDSTTLRIHVDTSFNLTHSFNYTHILPDGNMVDSDSIVRYKSFVVISTNLSDSLIFLSDCWIKSYLIMQARNTRGEWVDIEKPDRIECGTGCRPVVVEPNQIVIAKLLRYRGDYRTECRLKYSKWGHNVYSNIFMNNIYKAHLSESM